MSEQRINKKIGKLKLPKSSNWMVHDLKHRIRRAKDEYKQGNYSRKVPLGAISMSCDFSDDRSMLLTQIKEMGNDLMHLRQIESDFVKQSSESLNEGRKRHQYGLIQSYDKQHNSINHWHFSREYMWKNYQIYNRRLSVYVGDDWMHNRGREVLDNKLSEYIYEVICLSFEYKYVKDNTPMVVLYNRKDKSYIHIGLDTLAKEFSLHSVFQPDYSGGLPNQCPSCEDEIYYSNGGFHAYNF